MSKHRAKTAWEIEDELYSDLIHIEPPKEGSYRWQEEVAFRYILSKGLNGGVDYRPETCLVKIPDMPCCKMGYMLIKVSSSGYSPIYIESESILNNQEDIDRHINMLRAEK